MGSEGDCGVIVTRARVTELPTTRTAAAASSSHNGVGRALTGAPVTVDSAGRRAVRAIAVTS